MPESVKKQLLEVARRILAGTVDEAILFAKSVAGRLDVDALMGLARAVQLYLNGRKITPPDCKKLHAFCVFACAPGAVTAFSRELGYEFE